ncbi:hypothetical protein QFZ30_004014 [Arthrobacter pascens]|uniref:hypothetical protein n=1 Tax=Arthrobacter pascens TaxID=1677 RepID=UPI002792B5E1|nr:hypothetical protein [Arthrobacter pascens]MDQ0680632.1 hypothetical protein [Arthrobacter pascens]
MGPVAVQDVVRRGHRAADCGHHLEELPVQGIQLRGRFQQADRDGDQAAEAGVLSHRQRGAQGRLRGRPGKFGHQAPNIVRMSGWNIGTGRTFDVEPQQGDVQRPVCPREDLALKDGLHKRHEDEVPHAASLPPPAGGCN